MGVALPSASYTADTEEGTITIEFAYSGWARAELEGGRAVQSRVGSPGELASLLARAGVPELEATAVARDAWRRRPADAGLEQVRPQEAAWRATGLPALLVVVFFAYLVVFYVLQETGHRAGAIVVASLALAFLAASFLYARRR